MRIKVMFLTILIILGIVASSFAISLYLTNHSLTESMIEDFALSCRIADDFISTKINLLKSDAQTVAAHLLKTDTVEEMRNVMTEQLANFPDSLAFTVFSRKSVLARYGYPGTPSELLDEKYIQRAFLGESIISTTRIDSNTGHLVMHVCVPVDRNRVLSVTFSGATFANILSDYNFWKTGNVFMIDEEGTMLANYRNYMVKTRYNFIKEMVTDDRAASVGEFFLRMTQEPKGSGFYVFEGEKRFCSFQRVSSSLSGWSIGVSAPIKESPATRTRNMLILASFGLFAVGALMAMIFASNIARPYYKIEEQNRLLNEMSEEARAANEAKSAFLAKMSHEIRTPMNAIIGFTQLQLSDDADPGEHIPAFGKIYSAGQTLLSIINDILDFSKIESGKFEISPVTYDLPSMINDVMTMNLFRIGGKPVEFVLDLNETMPAKMFGDDLRVKQVCNNLLSNAFKYTRKGNVTWQLTYRFEGTDDVWLDMTIRDTGVGLKPEDVDKLFSDYSQVNARSNRNIEGTGLGLALTKRLVEMMGGSVTVESEYGKGSVFNVHILQKVVTREPIGAKVTENLRQYHYSNDKLHDNLKFVRVPMPYAVVLVVDDNISNLEIAKGMMKPYKMRVDCVTRGQEAINLITEGEPVYNAVFMDHMMPGLDGIETTERIRNIPSDYARNLPIIALTANALVGNKEMFLSKGFNAFLTKPMDIVRLDSVLRRFVRKKELNDEITPAESAAPESADMALKYTLEGIDLAKLLDRFGGDNDSFVNVLNSYAKHNGAILNSIGEVSQEELADYATKVHGIKGSSWGICAADVGDMAEKLEHAAKAGDLEFVRENNKSFIEAANELIGNINSALASIRANQNKPKAAVPDAETLKKLAAACEAFDIDAVDECLAELSQYEYENESDELLLWLKEKAAISQFTEIAERLRS